MTKQHVKFTNNCIYKNKIKYRASWPGILKIEHVEHVAMRFFVIIIIIVIMFAMCQL